MFLQRFETNVASAMTDGLNFNGAETRTHDSDRRSWVTDGHGRHMITVLMLNLKREHVHHHTVSALVLTLIAKSLVTNTTRSTAASRATQASCAGQRRGYPFHWRPANGATLAQAFQFLRCCFAGRSTSTGNGSRVATSPTFDVVRPPNGDADLSPTT
jgi:hypothetical protein